MDNFVKHRKSQSDRKNLLVLTSTFPRWNGDTEPRFVYDLCSRLTSNFNVIVLSPHTSGARQEEIMEDIVVYRYRYAPEPWEQLAYEGGITAKLRESKLRWILLPTFFLAQLLAIRKIMKQKSIDIIQAHWIIPQGMLALVSRCLNERKPQIICTSHGGDLFGLSDPVSKIIKRWVINRVDWLTVVSSSMVIKVVELTRVKSEQCTVIPMGTDLANIFIPDQNKQRKPFQLLFVGRLVEKKGLKYLVKILPSLLKDFPEIYLKIIGNGPEKEAIESLAEKLDIAERVHFFGRVAHKDLVGLYQESAMAIFPFIQAADGDMEGLGLVMVEALGCQCPVIAGDVPAVHDVIEDKISGLIVNPKRSDSLQQAIIRILDNQGQANKMAERGREYVLRNFSWGSVVSRHIEILNKAGNF